MNELALFAGAGESSPDVASRELRKEKQVGGPVNCSDSELCTFLQALVEGYLPTYYSDTSQSVQSKSMSIASRSYQRGKKTVAFHGFQSLQMSRNLTEYLGEELLTWFLAGFPAKTFPVQEKAQALTASEADSGQKWRGLLGRYDRDSCLWKTAQCSLIEDSDECLATFPRWGMTRNGGLYQQQIPALRTSASVSGLWATPTTMDSLPPKSAEALHREATVARPGRSKPANLRDQVSNARNWPTPAARDYKGARKPETMAKTGRNPNTNSLPDAVEFQPIETARNWPTPNASDHIQRKTSKSWAAKGRTNFVLSNPEVTGVEGGRLNPQWVEWLMGWPLGWTDLKPLETGKFREWQQQHSPSWPNN